MVYGIGINNAPKNFLKDKYNKRVYELWRHMLCRCTPKYWEKYKTYTGTKVSDSWKYFLNFYHDIPKLNGYDKWLENKEKMLLDKDLKGKGQKLYSLETCCFLTQKESALEVLNRTNSFSKNRENTSKTIRQKYGYKIKVLDIQTNEVIYFNSLKELAKYFHVYPNTIARYIDRQDNISRNGKTGRIPQPYFKKRYKITTNGEKLTYKEKIKKEKEDKNATQKRLEE